MRLTLSLAVLGLLLAGAAPALAQNNQTQQQGGYYPVMPIYNSNVGVPYFSSQNNGAAPMYNNGSNTPALPMQQMIAGKNAPSYTYGTNGQPQSYTGFGNNNNPNMPTPMNQIQGGSYDRAGETMAYQQQYLQQMQAQMPYQQQQQQPQSNSSIYQGNAFSQLYANATGQDKPVAPKKQRVVYKERNNPLIVPPRLFSLDE